MGAIRRMPACMRMAIDAPVPIIRRTARIEINSYSTRHLCDLMSQSARHRSHLGSHIEAASASSASRHTTLPLVGHIAGQAVVRSGQPSNHRELGSLVHHLFCMTLFV